MDIHLSSYNFSTFIFAGVDTTSNAVSRVLHMLCQHHDVQDKLRAEIHAAIEHYGVEIPYDELSALSYLDAVCRETLRVFAPVAITGRTYAHSRSMLCS